MSTFSVPSFIFSDFIWLLCSDSLDKSHLCLLFIIIVITAFLNFLILFTIISIISSTLLAYVYSYSFVSLISISLDVLRISRRLFKQGIIQWIEILSLPVLPYISSCFLKVRAYFLVLFSSLYFRFNPLFSITPFFHCLLQLLLPSLLLEYSVLILIPDFFHFLFLHISSGIVVIEVRLAFEAVLALELDWLTSWIEVLKRMRLDWLFIFLKYTLYWMSLGSHIP